MLHPGTCLYLQAHVHLALLIRTAIIVLVVHRVTAEHLVKIAAHSHIPRHPEDAIYARIPEFPVEIIALEKYENTLDHYILHGDITDKELGSIIMQILMMLITYQKVFHMTHNDLHTNNIMYTSTKKEFLYYRYNDIHYKVPTFGKLYKIIDYGRAIYHFNGTRICSDSFHKDGDGATQYNCEPYYNNKKKWLNQTTVLIYVV